MPAASQHVERHDLFRRVPFPAERQLVVDSLRLGRRKLMMHGFLEIDVTRARTLMRQQQERGGRPSFTGFVAACVGRAVAAHPEVHALRDGLGRLVMFEEVDVAAIVEVEFQGRKFGLAHVLRAAHRRTARELGEELRAVKSGGADWVTRRLPALRLLLLVPAFLRRLAYRVALSFPRFAKHLSGTVTLTAVGMFGGGIGWGVSPPTVHTLSVLVGGVGLRPAQDGSAAPREVLCLTISADHDVVDGAPLARFVRTLRGLLETADGLAEGM